jgi:hypothetical protein
MQTRCLRGRQQDFVAGTRVPGSGLPRVFVRTLAYISMQTTGGSCRCTRSVRSTQPDSDQHSPRVRRPFDRSTSKRKRGVLLKRAPCAWCPAPRPRPRPSGPSPCRPRHRPGAAPSHRCSPFGLWSGYLPGNVITRKAQRRIHADERRPGRRSSSGFPPLAPTMQAGQDHCLCKV